MFILIACLMLICNGRIIPFAFMILCLMAILYVCISEYPFDEEKLIQRLLNIKKNEKNLLIVV